jgi:hypothetical protein
MSYENIICNQCDRGCPTNNLQCGKGRRYFDSLKQEIDREAKEREQDDVLAIIEKCGHFLHHRQEEDHSQDDGILMQSLSKNEKEILKLLLSKLSSEWDKYGAPHVHEQKREYAKHNRYRGKSMHRNMKPE